MLEGLKVQCDILRELWRIWF